MANATEWEPGVSQSLVRATLELLKGTSATSMTLASSGNFTFITQPNLYFDKGEWILLVDDADSDNWMSGQIVSYNPITGSAVFESKVHYGSGTISDWLVYLAGAWIDNPWNGGTVANAVQVNNTLGVTGTSTLARVNASGPVISTAGDVNLNTTVTLTDTDQTLTAAQLFGGTLIITPTASRILTLPTAAAIIAYLSGYVVGSKFEFTVVNESLNTVTIAPGTGVIQLGKTLIQDGAATFKVTVDSPSVVSVINESTAVISARSGAISSSLVTSSAVDITLTNTSAGLQVITMTEEGKFVTLPDATGLYISAPTFILHNTGYYPYGVKNADGVFLGSVAGGGNMVLSLTSNSTVAGGWIFTGDNIESSLLSLSTILPSTYDVTRIFNTTVQVTSELSLHFAQITTGGLAVFLVDNTNRVIGSPTTLSTVATTYPKAAFRIDDDRAIIFYSDTDDLLYASVVVLLTPILIVGLAANTGTVLDIAMEDAQSEPKIAQLDAGLFVVSYATADGAGVTAVRGCQVSDVTTVTFGSAANINSAADNQKASTVTFPLTTTTALVLYKVAGAPILNKAVVVSVTNANPPVCTVGTPVSAQNSTTKKAASCNLLSPTLAVLVDDDNVSGKAIATSLTIAGSAITVGAEFELDTGIGKLIDYKVDSATRFNPHVHKLAANKFLWWCRDSTGTSRVQVATVTAGVISTGNILKGSFSAAADGTIWAGNMLPMGTTEFVGVMVSGSNSADSNRNFIAIAHKITGDVITVGKVLDLYGVLANSLLTTDNLIVARLPSGVYAVGGLYNGILGGDVGINLFKTDGINIIDRGIIAEYATGYRIGTVGAAVKYFPVVDNRIVALGATHGIMSPATVAQLKIVNIEVAE